MPYPCPICNSKTMVIDTRNEWRWRRCLSCKKTFHTVESEAEWPYKKELTALRTAGRNKKRRAKSC
jgi:transcriptional regulator NrdR family protein